MLGIDMNILWTLELLKVDTPHSSMALVLKAISLQVASTSLRKISLRNIPMDLHFSNARLPTRSPTNSLSPKPQTFNNEPSVKPAISHSVHGDEQREIEENDVGHMDESFDRQHGDSYEEDENLETLKETT